MSTLMIANPRKRRRRARTMTAKQRKYFGGGRRRSSRRRSRTVVKTVYRRSSAPRVAARRSRRRSRGIGGSLFSGGGIVGTGKSLAINGAAAAAGIILAPMALDKLPYVRDLTGNQRIMAKGALALAVGIFARRIGVPQAIATPIAVGIAAGAASDLYANWQASRGNPTPELSGIRGLRGGIGQPGGIGYRGLHVQPMRRFAMQN